MKEKIYKSCTPGLSDEEFKLKGGGGSVCFVSYARLLNSSIEQAVGKKPNERIAGLVMDYDGITVHFVWK